MRALRAKISRLAAVYREVGVRGITKRVARRLRPSGGSEYSKWLREKHAIDTDFDETYGVETGGIQELFDMDIVGENARHGITHIATDPLQFKNMMRRLNLDVGDYTFIDLGSGKGRAVILASTYPFKRVIGVEFAAELHEAAQQNVTSMAYTSAPIELIHGDAAAYRFPDGPLVVYLFNPFGSVIVRRVAASLRASWRMNPRPIRIVYANPLHLGDFVSSGWRVVDDTADPLILEPIA